MFPKTGSLVVFEKSENFKLTAMVCVQNQQSCKSLCLVFSSPFGQGKQIVLWKSLSKTIIFLVSVFHSKSCKNGNLHQIEALHKLCHFASQTVPHLCHLWSVSLTFVSFHSINCVMNFLCSIKGNSQKNCHCGKKSVPLSLFVITCHCVSSRVITCHCVSLRVVATVANCAQSVVKCCHLSLHVITCCYVSLRVVTCTQLRVIRVVTCR